jgi:hypothetical protein
MLSFGFTILDGDRTRIVLHANFENFGNNDDPEGPEIGAAKVTCAHELKHASQHEMSGWVEGSWLELDAVWTENLVYPMVNDYYRFLTGPNAISKSWLALDAGGGASYDDSIWNHFLEQKFGVQLLELFWEERESKWWSSMLDSYAAVLGQAQTTLQTEFLDYATWSYLTGTRATPGIGFTSAAAYPTAVPTRNVTSYPLEHSASVARLATDILECTGWTADFGSVDFEFSRPPGSQLRLRAVVMRRDGGSVIEQFEDTDTISASIATPLQDIQSVGFLVINPEPSSLPTEYSLDISETIEVVQALLSVGGTAQGIFVSEGMSTQLDFQLSNEGTPSSRIDYEVHVLADLPAKRAELAKSVTGSTLSTPISSYAPGETRTLSLSLDNASTDEEWLKGCTLTVPAGVQVLSSSDLVGGSFGALATDASNGDGATVSWFGTFNGNGVLRDGETAVGSVDLLFSAGLWGELVFDYSIEGDNFAAPPHTLQGSFSLSGPNGVQLNYAGPPDGSYLRIGSDISIQWTTQGASGPSTVDVELSRDGGASWESLAAATANDGNFVWNVSGPSSADGIIRISSVDGSLSTTGSAQSVLYDGLDWATTSPTTGSLLAGENAAIQIQLNATALSPSSYGGLVVFVDAAQDLIFTLPLQLEVLPAVVAVDAPTRPTYLAAPRPNPFNPATEVRFHLLQQGEAKLRIYDARGSLVRELVREVLSAGEHRRLWRGLDDDGQAVASGVYRVVLEANGRRQVQSAVLVR